MVEDRDQGAGCLWGEVNATICRRLGAVGVVTDGLVRDLPAVEALGFRYLARGVGVARSNTRVIETNGAVEVGSVHFEPGDLVHADRHGALQIPIDLVDELLVAARDRSSHARRDCSTGSDPTTSGPTRSPPVAPAAVRVSRHCDTGFYLSSSSGRNPTMALSIKSDEADQLAPPNWRTRRARP